MKFKKEQQHYEIEKQFKKAEQFKKSHISLFEDRQSTAHHPQAIYTSRLLNSDLPECDNIDDGSVLMDFTKLNS